MKGKVLAKFDLAKCNLAKCNLAKFDLAKFQEEGIDIMFKFLFAVIVASFIFLAMPAEVFANGNGNGILPAGNMSFFGGISEGVMLPRTTEIMLVEQGTRRNRRQDLNLRYTEMVFLDGAPVRFDGTLGISTSGTVDMDNEVGTFNVTHTVESSAATADWVDIERDVTFRVNYRVAGSQVIFTYDAQRDNWDETIILNDTEFVLDADNSHFVISIIEDRTPGVSYYRGDISARLVYVDDAGNVTVQEKMGSFHGYRSAWSATETHRIDSVISHYLRDDPEGNPTLWEPDWQMHYQIRPSITMNKVLQFVRNEPTAISFDGNFREVMQNNVGLRYDIFVAPSFVSLDFLPLPPSGVISGVVSIDTPNTFEQLPSPDLNFLRGNAAEDDIRRLFATQILTGDPRFFQPEHAISRGQFVAAVARAIRLPIEEPVVATRGRVQPDVSVFFDVPNTRPEYRYIMAAYRSGLAVGRANSMFYFDYPIDRQEAFMILIRALGLSHLSLTPTPVTPFADDFLIAPWAHREVTAAWMIGLAEADQWGNFNPTVMLTMGEAANIINELVEYMRVGLVSDYADQIVNIAN